jgi:hypothetical protein
MLLWVLPVSFTETGVVHTIFDTEGRRFSFERVPLSNCHGNAMPWIHCFSFTPRIVRDLH